MDGPGGGFFPFQKTDNRLGPPQISVELPVQVIEQSLVAATAPVEAIEVPQSIKNLVSAVETASVSLLLTALLRILCARIVITKSIAVTDTGLVRHTRSVHV